MTLEERLVVERLAENARQNYDKVTKTACSLVLRANFSRRICSLPDST